MSPCVACVACVARVCVRSTGMGYSLYVVCGLTGTRTVFKVLVESGYAPRRTIEFIGWAAEEVGLRGSNDISADYAARGIDVIAV